MDFEELERYEPVEPEWELFDLVKDPGEMNNVYTHPEYAKDVKQLTEKLLSLKKQCDDEDGQYTDLQKIHEAYYW